MLLEIELIRAREFIRVGPKGELDLLKSRHILEKLSAACRKRGTERALLDVREVWSRFGPEELATCVDLFGEIAVPCIQRLALLHGVENRRRARNLAMMASLRGWEVRAFCDFEAAFKWLALREGKRAARPARASGEQRIAIRHGGGSRTVEQGLRHNLKYR